VAAHRPGQAAEILEVGVDTVRREIQAGPHRVVSLMTSEAADELALEVGDLAVGVLKATSVIIEVPPAI
jgi:molybdopterin-binding protein